MNFDVLKEKFDIEIINNENSFEKIRVNSKNIHEILNSLKNNAEFDFDRLNTIIAIDLMSSTEADTDKFELIYDLHSSTTNQKVRISVLIDRNSPKVPSVVDVFKSAYFDECEIYDMFGIEFVNNPNLKRLFMPKSWIGHPMRRDYVLDDKRLSWNEEPCTK